MKKSLFAALLGSALAILPLGALRLAIADESCSSGECKCSGTLAAHVDEAPKVCTSLTNECSGEAHCSKADISTQTAECSETVDCTHCTTTSDCAAAGDCSASTACSANADCATAASCSAACETASSCSTTTECSADCSKCGNCSTTTACAEGRECTKCDAPQQAYVIEPPDVLSIAIVSGSPCSDCPADQQAFDQCRRAADKHLVAADGNIEIHGVGKVKVAGCTPEQAKAAVEARLAERWKDAAVRLDVAQFNSKVVYVIHKTPGGASVERHPITMRDSVGELLMRSGQLFPNEFAVAKIRVCRSAPCGAVTELPVVWMANPAVPTPHTNHALQPGDRIHVEQVAVQAPNDCGEKCELQASCERLRQANQLLQAAGRYVRMASATPAPQPVMGKIYAQPVATTTVARAADGQCSKCECSRKQLNITATPAGRYAVSTIVSPPAARAENTSEARSIAFQISVLEDTEGNLAEFKSLAEGASLVGEAETTLGAIRILRKNDLVKTLANPQMMCQVGHPAEMAFATAVEQADPAGERQANFSQTLKLKIEPTRVNGRLCVAVSMQTRQHGQTYAVETAEFVEDAGQTLIVRAEGPASQDEKSGAPVYVVITPTVLP